MPVYCIEPFVIEFNKLKKKKQYKSLEKDLIDCFFEKEFKNLISGTRLNNDNNTPYIKKRIKGSGGYRIYYLAILKDESIYLMFIHPKTGPDGAPNITDESIAYLYKCVLECIKNNDFYELNHESGVLLIEKHDPTKKKSQANA